MIFKKERRGKRKFLLLSPFFLFLPNESVGCKRVNPVKPSPNEISKFQNIFITMSDGRRAMGIHTKVCQLTNDAKPMDFLSSLAAIAVMSSLRRSVA